MINPEELDAILSHYQGGSADLIPVLQDIQGAYDYLPMEMLKLVAQRLRVPLTQIYSVATFYNMFSLVPKGRYQVRVCSGTACHLKGGPSLVRGLERDLKISPGQTTEDQLFTLETVNCLGACALAPLVAVGAEYHPHASSRELSRVVKQLRKAAEEEPEVKVKAPEPVVADTTGLPRIRSAQDLNAFRDQILSQRDPNQPMVIVCHGTGCLANNSPAVAEALRRAIQDAKIKAKVVPQIKTTGCHGFCSRAPVVVVQPAGFFYQNVAPDDAAEIVKTTLMKGKPVERLLALDHHTGEHVPLERDIPFYKHQTRIVLNNIGKIDPTDVHDTIAVNGYQAAVQALTTLTPDEIINAVEASGLRGRGGGGFPTGRKWRSCKAAPGDQRFIICNGDEGDPGAFMDRSIMEGDPHRVLEGMIIGAYAIGASQGFIYVRAEYPLAVKHLTIALEQARSMGLLGKDILGTGFDFDIKINRGGGAFVCGESTALMASLEGKPGEPRAKYIHTVEKGLWSQPSNLNNVETWANVPVIITRGADWYRSIGTEGSKGTKVFSLVGAVNHTGLVEVAMGTSLRQAIYDMGGGIPGDRDFKAVQIGGPSGGCVPAQYLDLPVDYDSLQSVGSMMGSGGMIVMDTTSCMVDVARYFMSFCHEESCGKCTPCREGTKQILEILTEITQGRGSEEHLALMEELCATLESASLCALGQSAAKPVLSTMKYFRGEYEAHVRDKKCPALVCRALLKYTIDPETCTGCLACVRECPAEAIKGEAAEPQELDRELCIKCGRCYEICKFNAVKVES